MTWVRLGGLVYRATVEQGGHCAQLFRQIFSIFPQQRTWISWALECDCVSTIVMCPPADDKSAYAGTMCQCLRTVALRVRLP